MKKPLEFALCTLGGGAVFIFLDTFASTRTAFSYLSVRYGHALLAVISVINGPIFGIGAAAVGGVGRQLLNGLMDWPEIFCLVLSAGVIGFIMRKSEIKSGFFGRKDIFRFIIGYFVTSVVCWVGFYPLLHHYVFQHNINDYMHRGLTNAMSFSFSALIISTIFIATYAGTRISTGNFYRS